MVFLILSTTKKEIKDSTLTGWGRRTVSILVFSGFLVKALFKVVQILGINYKSAEWYIAVPIAIPISIFVILICGNKWVYEVYYVITKKIAIMVSYGEKND